MAKKPKSRKKYVPASKQSPGARRAAVNKSRAKAAAGGGKFESKPLTRVPNAAASKAAAAYKSTQSTMTKYGGGSIRSERRHAQGQALLSAKYKVDSAKQTAGEWGSAAQRAALKKAQEASAADRRGKTAISNRIGSAASSGRKTIGNWITGGK